MHWRRLAPGESVAPIPAWFVRTLRPPAKVQRDVSSWIETHHGIGTLVDDPKVVVFVVTYAVRVTEAIDASANFAHELAVLVELQQLRRRIAVERSGRGTARMVQHHHVAF